MIYGYVRVSTKEQNAAIVVLDMPLLDTRESKDLTGIAAAKAHEVKLFPSRTITMKATPCRVS